MRFKDLPPLEKIVELRDSFYSHYAFNTSGCSIFLHYNEEPKFSCSSTIDYSCNYLHMNPDFEVRDDFFGNNFPFLRGKQYRVPNKPETNFLVIYDLQILRRTSRDVLKKSCDVNIYEGKNVNDFLTSAIENDDYISMHSDFYFATKTYDELVQRIEVASVMLV